MTSIMQTRRECYACRELYGICTNRGLEEHHVVFGTGRRELSEQYGLKVLLCERHHNQPPGGVHFDPDLRHFLERRARKAYVTRYGAVSWRQIFGETGAEGGDAEDGQALGVRPGRPAGDVDGGCLLHAGCRGA